MKPTRARWAHLLPPTLLVLAGLGAGGWYAVTRSQGGEPSRGGGKKAAAISVEVVRPVAGGLDRVCIQPGTVEPIKSADVFAKASGFLVKQTLERGGRVIERDGRPEEVDIGTRVQAGDVLARISVPEYDKRVTRDEARVKDASARVRQMEAHQKAAESESRAAAAAVTLARVAVRGKTAYRMYREKQLARYRELAKGGAIEPRQVEEQEDFYLSALEGESAAQEGVNAAVERAAAAKAKIDQAAADLDEAKAGVDVAIADLEASKVLLGYTVVTSPFTGVVTRRSFNPGHEGQPGAFIRSADQGGTVPLFTVEQTNVMRVVIQVPDREVRFISRGDPAVVEIDALPGVTFEGPRGGPPAISRWSKAEDPTTRTMRVEIDVRNPTDPQHPDGVLTAAMYGRVTLMLQPGAKTAVRVPSRAVISREVGGTGKIRVVRGESLQSIQTVAVTLGADNGVDAEVLAGLTADDQVVVRTSGPAEDGTAVTIAGR